MASSGALGEAAAAEMSQMLAAMATAEQARAIAAVVVVIMPLVSCMVV